MSGQNIGKNLEAILKRKRITQDDLVEMTKGNGRPVSKRTISRVIAGDCKEHRKDTINDIAAGLGVTVEELLGITPASTDAAGPVIEHFGTPVESAPETNNEARPLVRIPLKKVESTRQLEIAMGSTGLRLERSYLEGEEQEDLVARVYQLILDGRDRWHSLNLIEQREVLKEIMAIVQSQPPMEFPIEPVSLYVGYTLLDVVDRRGDWLGGGGKMAFLVADSFLDPGYTTITSTATINIDHPVVVVS